MRDGHLVLCERARLVWADDAGGAQGLHALQILHQAVLRGHPLRGEAERDGDGDEDTLGNVGDQDPDQEENSWDEFVAHGEGCNEEGDAYEAGDHEDDLDEGLDFLVDGSLTLLQGGHDPSDGSDDCGVPGGHHQPPALPLQHVGGEKGHVPGLQFVRVPALRVQGDGDTLPSQAGVVNLDSAHNNSIFKI